MAQGINVGGIYADLDIRTGNLDRGLAKGRAALDAIAKEVKQLTQDLADGAIGMPAYTARMAALGTTATELTTRMNAAYSATTTLTTGLELVTKNANDMVHATNRMGQGMLQLGYIADDLQYGFSGVVNNIAPLVHGLGGTAGVASAAQLAAVAVHQLYIHWNEFTDILGTSVVRSEAEEMEKLARVTMKTADEQERLNRHKERQIRIEKMMKKESKETIATRNAVEEIFAEAGTDVVASHLAKTMTDKATPEEQAELEKAKATLKAATELYGEGSGEARSAQRKLDKMARFNPEEGKRRAETVMDAAAMPQGQDARDRIMSAFGDSNHPLHHVAEQLAGASPEARAEEKKQEALAEIRRKAEAEKLKEDEAAKREQERAEKEALKDREKFLGRMAFLEEQATKRKLTPGEGAELAGLLQADVDRQNADEERQTREKQQADDKKAREAKQLERENLRAGMEAAPGDIKAMASTLVMQESAGMIAPGAAFGRIQKAIEDNGATTDEAIAATKEIQSDAVKDMEKGITDRLMNPTAQEQRKQSQVFDATSLAAQFQSSVGGDESKKQTTLLEKLEKHVDALAKGGKLAKIK